MSITVNDAFRRRHDNLLETMTKGTDKVSNRRGLKRSQKCKSSGTPKN